MAMLDVAVWRSGREGDAGEGALQHFAVPRRDNQTVLDVVVEIQRTQDASLAFRYACRVGMCGSCAMVVNGAPRWTCRTRAAQVADGDALQIEPLRNLPVVKDLAVDMQPFFDKWARAGGAFVPGDAPARVPTAWNRAVEKDPRHDLEHVLIAEPDATSAGHALAEFATVPPATRERRAADAAVECIGCGVCYSACDVVSWNPDYLGPAALNRAWTLQNDVRDRGGPARRRAVSGDAGCHSCHSHQSCTEFCPKHLSPTNSIAGLKRATLFGASGK